MLKTRIGRKTKKFVALVLSATLILSLGAVPVFAAESATSTAEETGDHPISSPEELIAQQGGSTLGAGNAVLGGKVTKPGKVAKITRKKYKRSSKKGEWVLYNNTWSAAKNATGYQTQSSRYSNFKSHSNYYTTSRTSGTKVTGVTKGVVIYWRVRAFRIVGSNVYYGPWHTIHYTAKW